MTEERIKARIAQLKAEREQFVVQANNQVAGMNGAIAALEELLVPEEANAPPTA